MSTATFPSPIRFRKQNSLKALNALFLPSEEDRKFTRILAVLLALYFLVALTVSLLEQVEVPRKEKEKVPVQLAKIILEKKQLPPPEKKVIKEKPKKEKVKKKKPPVEKKVKPKKQPPVQQRREQAREKAKNSGLAAMKDELFAMREVVDIKPTAVKKLNKNQQSEVKVKRKLLAAQANKQSTRLASAKTVQTVVSDKLSTRNTQQIRLSEEEVKATQDELVAEQLAKEQSSSRSEMALRRTLEAHKARLYALYNRALRKDPFLQGKVLFEIEIQPSGKVSAVNIKQSELNNAQLERRLSMVLKSIRFAKEDVATMTTIWAVDFIPN
jgi:outer membrane biosynthesis protein TonB